MAADAPADADPMAAAKAEIAAFEAAHHPPPAPAPAKAANAEATPKTADAANESKDSSGLADSAATPAPAANAQAPAGEETVDTSYLPDEVRAEVTVKSPAAAKRLKSMVMGHAAVTQGLQEIAHVRRAAANWDAATADPVKAEKITRILLDGRLPEEPAKVEEPEIPDDFNVADPKALLSLIDKRAEKIADRKVEARVAEMNRPSVARTAINEAIGAYAASKEIAPETMQAAVALWKQDCAENGMDPLAVDPRAVPALIAPYVRLTRVAAKPAPAPQTNGAPANGRAGGLSEVASPNGRTSTSSGSTLVVPDHIRQNRAPRNDAEVNAEYEYAFRKRFGSEANPS